MAKYNWIMGKTAMYSSAEDKMKHWILGKIAKYSFKQIKRNTNNVWDCNAVILAADWLMSLGSMCNAVISKIKFKMNFHTLTRSRMLVKLSL